MIICSRLDSNAFLKGCVKFPKIIFRIFTKPLCRTHVELGAEIDEGRARTRRAGGAVGQLVALVASDGGGAVAAEGESGEQDPQVDHFDFDG